MIKVIYKKVMAYLYDGMLSTWKRNEVLTYCSNWNKPDIKRLYDFDCVRHLE